MKLHYRIISIPWQGYLPQVSEKGVDWQPLARQPETFYDDAMAIMKAHQNRKVYEVVYEETVGEDEPAKEAADVSQ